MASKAEQTKKTTETPETPESAESATTTPMAAMAREQQTMASVMCVVVDREPECCGVVARGGLLGDAKFGRRKRGDRELLATSVPSGDDEATASWEPGQANEQLVLDGVDLASLKPGDRVRICPGDQHDTSRKVVSAVEARCDAIARKLWPPERGPRKGCVELEFHAARDFGSGGAFFSTSTAGLVCAGDKVDVVKQDRA
ncbi:Hypothetical Protein FCC1311_012632 [Hondaea fermentalgiana]|uniref:Uncharacterized protein n=1 Tax=Hondaea fermentalgiana TaxID=2315210 RepID=A0A2R5G203_9STRA|nr:Hypothetical Protein FCC1311_012632 [Hondaea fermentalgiana]|eukprot:GBG25046.1 Hypothetical Protein FCC1311_012632 [Hondaea fermentalgiana]